MEGDSLTISQEQDLAGGGIVMYAQQQQQQQPQQQPVGLRHTGI